MAAQVLDMAAFLRRHAIRDRAVPMELYCLHCGTRAHRVAIPGRPYYDCKACDEVAAVPYHRFFPT